MPISHKRWQEILCQARNNELSALFLIGQNIGDSEAKELAEAFKCSDILTELLLCDNNIGDEGAKKLVEIMKTNYKLSILNLNSNNIGNEAVKLLGETLNENNYLVELKLSDNNIGTGGASSLGEVLKSNCTLASLMLDSNEIGIEGAENIAEGLKSNHALSSLSLADNKLEEEGTNALIQALNYNNTLIYLDLHNNNTGNKEASELAQVLRYNSSLTCLKLGGKSFGNTIGDEGVKQLAEALKCNQTLISLTLESHYFAGGGIKSEGASALAEALKSNRMLTHLNLEENKIGQEGAEALANALESNNMLTYLNLHSNKIGDVGAKKLAEALKYNRSLTELNLDANSMGERGISQLAEALRENKCLSYYCGGGTSDTLNLIKENKHYNENLAGIINSEFENYLKRLINDESTEFSSELNLEELNHRSAAINYILQSKSTTRPEEALFFSVMFEKLKELEKYNSIFELFESTIYELAMQLNEGYYKQIIEYPGIYIHKKLTTRISHKIIDEEKEKLLSIPAVVLYNASIGAYKQGNYQEALKNLEEALVKAPGEPRIMLEKVKVLYLIGCFQQADEEFSGVLGTTIGTTDKFIEIRDWFEQRGDINKAIALHTKLPRGTDNNKKLAKLILLQFENHCPGEVLESLDKLINREPEEFSVYQMKAKLHYILGDGGFDKVIKAGEKMALPKLAEYRELAGWLDKHNDTSRASSYYKKAGALERKIQGLKILQNWLQADNTNEFAGLSKLIEQINSDSIKYAKELNEFEEVIELRGEFASNHTQLEVATPPADLLGIDSAEE